MNNKGAYTVNSLRFLQPELTGKYSDMQSPTSPRRTRTKGFLVLLVSFEVIIIKIPDCSGERVSLCLAPDEDKLGF